MSDWEDQPYNRPVFRHDKVHVNAFMCDTCVYRPGNLMRLNPGALKKIIEENHAKNTALVCHENMETRTPGVCHGFWEHNPTIILKLAAAMNVIAWQTPQGVVVQDNTKTTHWSVYEIGFDRATRARQRLHRNHRARRTQSVTSRRLLQSRQKRHRSTRPGVRLQKQSRHRP